MSDVTLHLGDCLEFMRTLDANSIDLTVTSPPYDNLRTYGGHSWNFEGVARELYRVTKQGGVVVWVVNDETVNGSESGTSFRQALYFMGCGFNLHDTMIYAKSNSQNPSLNRYEQCFEYMFVLAKEKPKTFNPLKDRRNAYAGQQAFGNRSRRSANGEMREVKTRPNVAWYGKRLNVWQMKTASQENICQPNEHPAMFPEALARDHILSWSNEGDTVLDCFLGSGTTGKMAVKLNRNFIGCEIHEPYFRIAERRIHEAQMQMRLPLGA